MSNLPERELTGIESALRELMPSTGDFDRDRLFFQAGQNAMRKRRWTWPLISAGLAGLAGTLAVLLALQPGPVPIERIVYVPLPRATPSPNQTDLPSTVDSQPLPERTPVALPGSYLRLRDQVLRFGVEALPDVTFPEMNQPTRPTSVFDSYEHTLPIVESAKEPS